MNIISTWIYLDSPDESSEYPQVGKGSHQWAFQKVYWRCVAVFFELSVRSNPDTKHILFSNVREADLPEIDGYNLRERLIALQVEVVTLPLTFQTPKGYHGKWRNQFYIFDILQFIEGKFGPQAALLVLDSDCLITRPLDAVFANLRQTNLLVLPMQYTTTHDINGITRLDMQQIYSELNSREVPDVPVYFGGEFFAATNTVVHTINHIVAKVWPEMLRRYEQGALKFNEEAHLLSYCYDNSGEKYGLADAYIKRIWTSTHFNNMTPTDLNLPIWHLPSEKTGGIALLFEHLLQGKGFWQHNGAAPIAILGGYVGIPKRTRFLNLKHWLRYSWGYRLFRKLNL